MVTVSSVSGSDHQVYKFMDELTKRINELLELADQADKMGLEDRSMRLLGQAAELETELIKLQAA